MMVKLSEDGRMMIEQIRSLFPIKMANNAITEAALANFLKELEREKKLQDKVK